MDFILGFAFALCLVGVFFLGAFMEYISPGKNTIIRRNKHGRYRVSN